MQERVAALSLSLFIMFVPVIASCNSRAAESCPPKGQVVFSALASKEQYTSDGGRYDLFLQTVPGGKITRLTNHRANSKVKLGDAIREPLFSRNGKRIAFLADYANSDERRVTMTGASPYPYTLLNIWQAVVPTHAILPLTKGQLGWHGVCWSYDDRFLTAIYPSRAGVIDQDTPILDDIYIYNTSKAKIRKLARVSWGAVNDLFWSLDSQNVLFQLWSHEGKQNPDLYTVRRVDGKSRILIEGKGERFGYTFSPDNRRVAFVQGNAVYVAGIDGTDSSPAVVSSNSERDLVWPKPKWSMSGDYLAAAEVVHDTGFSHYQTKLHVYDAVSRKDRMVTILPEDVTEVVWSRNGQWLIVKMSRAGNTEKPDPETGWHTFRREGLLAVAVSDGHVVTLKEPNEETKGLDWFETKEPLRRQR